jgi:endonuclease/exonuclease/phosphatase family metal-dependent hydrolase
MVEDQVGLDMIKWEARGPRIVEVILSQKPDIVTLQEVDEGADGSNGFTYLYSELVKHGYGGDFSMAPVRAKKDPAENKGKVGNAIFYRQELLRKTESTTIPLLNNKAQANACQKDGVDVTSVPSTGGWTKAECDKIDGAVFKQGEKPAKQNAMYSRLQLKTTGEEIAVACIHLRSGTKPSEAADRLGQAESVIDALPRDIPIIIGGDLNSSDAAVVSLIVESRLGVESAYGEQSEDAWTTWKDRVTGGQPEKIGVVFKHVIDYIFASSDHFRVLKLLDNPDEKEILTTASGKHTLLPHERYPSDHVSIMAELELRPRTTNPPPAE